jgi:hypothetical protein
MAQSKTRTKAARRSARARAKKLVDLVQKQIDEGATSVEEVHKRIADMPLAALERLDLFQETVKGARRVQEARIGAMYDVIRKVNAEAGKLARGMLRARTASRSGGRKAASA